MVGVGRSSRTPFKHWVLNSHLGKIVGVLSTGRSEIPAKAMPLLCIDMCAGDGEVKEEHSSSPFIITKHCEWLHARGVSKGITAKSVFIEAHANTFEHLESRVLNYRHNEKPMSHECVLLNMDARNFELKPTCDSQAIFVNCDPNSIAELPMVESFAKSLTRTTTITMTLGCNPNGLKRMPHERRLEWFPYIEVLLDRLPSWHDAILIRVVRDDAQWAYYTQLPYKWSSDAMADCKKRGEQMFAYGVDVASVKKSYGDFKQMMRELFLTKKELQDAAN